MAVDTEQQASALPPAQPSFIFRGHVSQIHSVRIVQRNTRLLTGDADGWVVYWKLESKRPLAVWKAHDAAILGTAQWGSEKLITHGRDNTLRIWQLGATDTSNFSTILPTDDATTHRPKPWLLHSLPVNTLNFCAFSMCHELHPFDVQEWGKTTSTRSSESILVAVPARDDKKVEVYQFPDEKLAYVVPRVESRDTGMVMAVQLVYHRPSNNTMLIVGYEGGFTAVHLLPRTRNSHPQPVGRSIPQLAQTVYLSQPHTQPVLSLDALPDAKTYFTSSADAVIASHRIPELLHDVDDLSEGPSVCLPTANTPELSTRTPPNPAEGGTSSPPTPSSYWTVTEETDFQRNIIHYGTDWAAIARNMGTKTQSVVKKHYTRLLESGQAPDLETIAAEADQKRERGEDVGPPPTPTPPPKRLHESTTSAGEKAHSESLSFPKRPILSPTKPSSSSSDATNPQPPTAGLSALLSSAAPQPKDKPSAPAIPTTLTLQTPHKTINTKHAGQQSLRVRSDGRLFVTGGWDSRIRIYSTKSLNEVAVLKWHKEGVYAVDFGEILHAESLGGNTRARFDDGTEENTGAGEGIVGEKDVVRREGGLSRLQRQRKEKMQVKHWVVAGAKDGKVSLWEVF